MRAKIIDRWQELELTVAEFSAAVPYTSGNGTVKERG
jgi:hypothetical protein